MQAYKQIHTSSPSCSPAPRSVDWVCVSMGFVSIFVCWFVCKPELCVGVCAPCLNCGFHSCLNSDPTWGFCKPWVSVWVCALCLSFGLNSRLNCGSKLGFGSCCFVCLQAYKQIHTSSPSRSPAPRSVDWVCVSWGLCLFLCVGLYASPSFVSGFVDRV